LNIQGEFKHEKGGKALKTKTKEIQAKRMKSQKSDGLILDSGGSGFLRTDKFRLGFEI
jgi:hypothetical protein